MSTAHIYSSNRAFARYIHFTYIHFIELPWKGLFSINIKILKSVTIRSDGTNHTCWWASCALGLPKQRQVQVDWYELHCSVTVQLAHQYVWFRTTNPDRAKDLFTLRISFSWLTFSRINKFFETDFTIKVNVKKQRRFDRSTVIFKLKVKIFFECTKIYTNDYKNANKILTKTLKYLHRYAKKSGMNNKDTLSK